MNVLFIVETPNKAKRIRELFPEFAVFATLGHFIDLIPEGMGTRLPEHTIQYAVVDGKQQVLAKLRAAAKTADVIYVATNPDDEGEAIAAQVFNALDKPHDQKVQRITPIAITQAAIQTALIHPRDIDWSLVRAYEARRVVDRYIGHCVSAEVTNKFTPLGFTSFMTSGRVQSIALQLIVERQTAIDAFVPTETFGITASIDIATKKLTAHWKPEVGEGELIKNIHDTETVLTRSQSLKLVDTHTKTQHIAPPQPLNTCRYLSLAANTLNLTVKQAMDAAQTLYEQGLITYHRTNSTQLSTEFAVTVREFAERYALPLPEIKPEEKTQSSVRNDAHIGECLRVIDIDATEPFAIKQDEVLNAIYRKIWLSTLESQLAFGENKETHFTFDNNHQDQFVAIETTTPFLDWREADILFELEKNRETALKIFDADTTELHRGESVHISTLQINTHSAESPTPYTESRLIEKLDALGIGSPSIYTETLERIIGKQYVSRCENTLQLHPTAIGIALINTLKKHFSFMDYHYATKIETAFSDIAHNRTSYSAVVNAAWLHLEHEITAFKCVPLTPSVKQQIAFLSDRIIQPAHKNISPMKTRTENHNPCSTVDKCPTCQKGNLRVTQFTQGEHIGKYFVGCSIFPTCNYFQLVQ